MSSTKLRFDGWVLDLESGDLERGGIRIRLQEQPAQVLRELIAHTGSVVSREQLIALLWPKSVVDFDTGLNAVVHKLRSALGDTSETPRYIETLPRRGYRFIGVLDFDREAHSTTSSTFSVSNASAQPPEPAPSARNDTTSSTTTTTAPIRRPRLRALALITALAMVALVIGVYAIWRTRSGANITSVPVQAPSPSKLPANVAPGSAVAFAPPPHSVVVLPFVNLSGDKDQQYFSDGLTEELLNSLAHIDGLQVAARTSSFSFREHPDIADVARKLNVGAVLEGSVRRSGNTVRISAQLINAMTGFHLWSQTYDRDLSDVLKLQTEIATAVASALEVSLLGDVRAKVELGGTSNPAAFDAYLRASKFAFGQSSKEIKTAIAGYTEAIRLDPNYALAFAYRSLEWTAHAEETHGTHVKGAAIGEDDENALADARHAITLAPELAEGHLALAYIAQDRTFDFAQTNMELERAVALAPGNALVLGWYGRFAVMMGRTDKGIAAARRAVILDPLNVMSHYRLGQSLYRARRYTEAVAAFNDVLALDPQDDDSAGLRGLAYYGLGDFQNARASCEARRDDRAIQWCLAVTYHMLARHADAETALRKLRAAPGDRWAYECAAIYAQWGNTSEALESLESAWRLRVPELRFLKVEPLMDPLRKEPRFQAIERELKFPN